ncbi:kinase-like domain-containing protein [Tirmania nivea]|nr:kinase-like domain-containing protein [Tirmania nivea]
MQLPGERQCMGCSLPITCEVLEDQKWKFPEIYERTPEATSVPRPSVPSDLLGEGTGGTVYKRELQLPRCLPPCLQCPEPQVCAVKRLGRNSEGHVLHAHSPDRREREKDIMDVLCKTSKWHSSQESPQSGYQFTVTYYGNYVDEYKVIHIVMEYMPDGDLGHYIKDFQWGENDAKIVAEQVLHALKFMHDNGVVHRDIKPFNIFPKMDEDCHLTIKVGDFGIANHSNQNEFFTYVGTTEYMAPERFANEHTVAVDSWAVGCLLFRVLTGHELFTNALEICQYEHTKQPCLLKGLSPFCRDLQAIDFIDKLIQPKADHRADPRAALNHPWLRELRESPAELGKRLSTQELKDHFDSVKSVGIKARSHIITNPDD